MGSALAFDLARSAGVTKVTLADIDANRAQETVKKIGSPLVVAQKLDVESYKELVKLLTGHDCALGAVSYRYNMNITRACLEAGVHFCDLGGNDEVVTHQRSLDSTARERNLTIVPNCGLAPGLANVLAARGAELFDSVDSIHIRVGGLPQHPKPPLNYQLVFSPEGLVNEYTGRAAVLRDSKRDTVETMTGIEEIEFPEPYGRLEAFHTSGGASLLPEMFEGSVRELDYKTIRYPGHCERFKALLDLGFASMEPLTIGSNVMTARELFFELLKKKLSGDSPDLVLLRTEIRGTRGGTAKELRFDLIDSYDKNDNITAMMRTTAFPTSVIAQMLVQGTIQKRGVLTPELCVPLQPMLDEMRARNMKITERWS